MRVSTAGKSETAPLDNNKLPSLHKIKKRDLLSLKYITRPTTADEHMSVKMEEITNRFCRLTADRLGKCIIMLMMGMKQGDENHFLGQGRVDISYVHVNECFNNSSFFHFAI